MHRYLISATCFYESLLKNCNGNQHKDLTFDIERIIIIQTVFAYFQICLRPAVFEAVMTVDDSIMVVSSVVVVTPIVLVEVSWLLVVTGVLEVLVTDSEIVCQP